MGRSGEGRVHTHLAEAHTGRSLSGSGVPDGRFLFAPAVVGGRTASEQKTSIISCLKESATPQFSRLFPQFKTRLMMVGAGPGRDWGRGGGGVGRGGTGVGQGRGGARVGQR